MKFGWNLILTPELGQRTNEKRRIRVLGIDLGFVDKKQLHHVLVPGIRRHVQRRLPLRVLGIDLGLIGKQQLHRVLA